MVTRLLYRGLDPKWTVVKDTRSSIPGQWTVWPPTGVPSLATPVKRCATFAEAVAYADRKAREEVVQ